MVTQRIEALDIDHRQLFTALYGINSTGEVYITQDMRVHSLWELLYLYLKEQGYIPIFYDDKAFSYEEEPLMRFFCFSARKNAEPSSGKKRDFFRGKGPMSNSRNMSITAADSDSHAANESHHDAIHVETSGNQRRFIVNQEEGFFKNIFSYSDKNPQSKLAVIFVSPATLKFDDDQRKVIINKWNELQNNFKRNKLALRIIVLYDYSFSERFEENFNHATDELFLLSPFKDAILNDVGSKEQGEKKNQNRVVFMLGGPGRDEIASMLNRRRLMTDDGLPALFSTIPWDLVVLRLWQGVSCNKNDEKPDDNKATVQLSSISDYLECEKLNDIIEKMDTVKAIDRLNALEGIDNIREQFSLYRKALADHRAGIGSGRFRPHMALMGSPGTGKSTVARLFGDILREDGLLPKGHFIKVTTGELIGQYIGETRPKTLAVCERARGGVLFIDEAHGLMSGVNSHGNTDYGKEAIEVLIQFMEDNDDSLVIFAGYTDEIQDLINNGDKGFRRRFNDLGFFEFNDYPADVLYRIASRLIKVPTTEDFDKALKGIIRYKWAYRNKKFGNVGEMENLINLITTNYLSLNTQAPLDTKHLPDDLKRLVDETLLNSDLLLAEFNDVIGQANVKEVVHKLFKTVVADRIKLRMIDNYIPTMPELNFLFIGNPGTGKTTIARKIGNVLKRLGIFPPSTGDILTEISGNNLLRCSPEDMKKLFEDNIGKVLIIDEAYQLCESPRVVADIVANTTLPEFKDKLSIIMAGYPHDINRLLNINDGLSRRFQEIRFTDYTDEELYVILNQMVAATPFTTMNSDECRDVAIRYFGSLVLNDKFGNAGEAEKLLKTLIQNRDTRFVDATPEQMADPDFAQRILPCDFPGYEDSCEA